LPPPDQTSDRDGLFDQAGGHPVLGLGNRLAFGDLDHVAGVVLALFVMGVVLARLGNDLAVELVLDTALDQDTVTVLARLSLTTLPIRVRLRDVLASVMVTPYLAAARFSARMVLARAMSRRVTAQRGVLLSCCVAFCMRRPKWAFCSSLDLGFQAGDVLLAQFSSFHVCDLLITRRACA
jgi:hypothetical protein